MHQSLLISLWLAIASLAAGTPWMAATSGHGRLATVQSSSSADSLTGCLQKGDKSGTFKLTTADGKSHEIASKNAALAGHVGHKVTVMGDGMSDGMKSSDAMAGDKDKMGAMKDSSGMGMSASSEKSMDKTDHGAMKAQPMQVSTVTMVSASCK